MSQILSLNNSYLRLLEPDDAEAFYTIIQQNLARLETFFAGTVAKTRSLKDTVQYMQEIEERKKARTYFPFGIWQHDTHQLIGLIDIKNVDWGVPKAEIGFFMDEHFAGKGIAREALQQVIAHAWETWAFGKLFLRTHPSNTAAIRLAEACGFEKEGLIRRDYKTTQGELVDLLYMGLLPVSSA